MGNIAGNLMKTTLSILPTNHAGSECSWEVALSVMSEKRINIL
jgi:hypothetical protein